jgi:hypothetical protein
MISFLTLAFSNKWEYFREWRKQDQLSRWKNIFQLSCFAAILNFSHFEFKFEKTKIKIFKIGLKSMKEMKLNLFIYKMNEIG